MTHLENIDEVVIDTDVVSYLYEENEPARRYAPYVDGKTWWVSFM